jgi:arylsulfatase A-like enzyme
MKRAVLVLFLLAAGVSTVAAAERPNILVIMTDDQRARGTVTAQAMPDTKVLFQDQGTNFVNAFATTPLCCPSRASFLTGQYAHNTGVRINADGEKLDHGTTIQRYLQDAGYQTGIVGKFLNDWPLDRNPPYFDRWSLIGTGYSNPSVNRDGTVIEGTGYSTDITAKESLRIMEAFEAEDSRPWMLLVWTRAPHGPFDPEPKYAEAPVTTWDGNPAVHENDLSDKPPYVRENKDPTTLADGRKLRKGQLRLLMSVDDMVRGIFDLLETNAEDAMSFFLSDNGFMWGEHGQQGKTRPYNHSAAIPLYFRWPGQVSPGTVDTRLVANIDVAPTIFEVTGVTPQHVVDGRSLLSDHSRDRLLLESWNQVHRIPNWFQYRAVDRWYTEYRAEGNVVFREHYDLGDDPWELRNKAASGPLSKRERLMRSQLALDRKCAGETCP